MSSVEDRMHAAMSAAADLAAREIPAAPPLRLPPETARGARRARPPRRWIRWTVPLAAAAAVIALAVSLALIKDIQNGSMVPPNPATTTGPGGIPRYYVALKQLATYTDVVVPPAGIVVGDSLTGGTLATFAPPARTTFASVTAAADDRTFVVFAVTSSTGSFASKARTTLTGRWYQVRLAPGAARPARLTRLPVKPVILTRDIPADAGQAALDRPLRHRPVRVGQGTRRTGMGSSARARGEGLLRRHRPAAARLDDERPVTHPGTALLDVD